MRYVLMALVIALAFTLLAESTMAQCVMCRASLGNNSVFMRNLNIGVLVLLVPPVTMFCSIIIVAYRHRKGGAVDGTEE